MDTLAAPTGAIDQVVAVRSRERPVETVSSTIVPPDRLIYVRGWAFGPPGTRFEWRLDETLRFDSEPGRPRPDIAAALETPAAAASGLEAFIDAQGIELGAHTVTLVAVDAERTRTLASVPLTLTEPRPTSDLKPVAGGQVMIDRLRVGARYVERETRALVAAPDELVVIEGWAVNAVSLRSGYALFALIDDRYALPVWYGRQRADLVDALGSPWVRESGFRAVIDPAPYADGVHVVRMVLVMDDGAAYACDDSIALCVERP